VQPEVKGRGSRNKAKENVREKHLERILESLLVGRLVDRLRNLDGRMETKVRRLQAKQISR
jgi:hypothetical protein